MRQNHEALAKAVRERRAELGLTQEAASEYAAQVDVDRLDGARRKSPGIAVTTWREIERAVDKERRPHTQQLLDWVLRWPEGTATALLYDRDLPDGPPLSMDGDGPDASALRAQALRDRAEVDGLWLTVADMQARMERVEQTLGKVLDAIEGG